MFKFIVIAAALFVLVKAAPTVSSDPSLSSELRDDTNVSTIIDKKFEFTERFIQDMNKAYNSLSEHEKLNVEDGLKLIYFFEDNQQIFSEASKGLKEKFAQIQEHMQKELENMTPEVQKFIKQTASILFKHMKSHLIEGKEINEYGIVFDVLEEYLEMSPAGQKKISETYTYVNDQVASIQSMLDSMNEKIRTASKPTAAF